MKIVVATLAGAIVGATLTAVLLSGGEPPSRSASPRDADGSMPRDPVSIAARSDRRSPNRLSVTITSNCFGQRVSCMAPASAYIWLSCTFPFTALILGT